jgi:uncharacterized surface protein with fasciclin (FAS1) repeats
MKRLACVTSKSRVIDNHSVGANGRSPLPNRKIQWRLKKYMADIVDIAVGAGAFTTLVTAVQAANLVDALKSPGPFTVFAPNDDAFAKLPPGTITTLVQNIPQLTRILTFHVVSGRYTRADLAKLGSVTSLEGAAIEIDISDEAFEVNNATVVAADIEADNGIIHVIDNVILMRPHWVANIMASGRKSMATGVCG